MRPRGTAYERVSFEHLSKILNIDVTAYDFRRLVVSWALNHKCEEIRLAEGVVLRHKASVAQEYYRTNKQLPAQLLIQSFNNEEGTCPEKMEKLVENSMPDVIDRIRNEEAEGRRVLQDQIKQDKMDHRLNLLRVRPLSSRNRTRYNDRIRFQQLVDKISEIPLHELVQTEKWSKWRKIILQLVYSTDGEIGAELRAVWIDFYQGDLLNGIRDARKLAQSKNWPRHLLIGNHRDRDSWISGFVYQALKNDHKMLTNDRQEK